METNLVVVRPFGPYAVGDVITGHEAIEATLGSDHADHVVRVTNPMPPTET